MSLEIKIDEENYKIIINGKPKEIETFAYCIEQTVSKGILKEELETTLQQIKKENTDEHKQFNFTTIHRAYINKEEIILLANRTNEEFYFPILKDMYEESKKIYDSKK